MKIVMRVVNIWLIETLICIRNLCFTMRKNNTDYDFPSGWGLFTPQQKSDWYLRERVFRQACRQNTAFGRRYQEFKEEQERLDTDNYRYS